MAKSIIKQTEGQCFLCGRTGYLEEHHIFFGEKHRRLSEKYGLKVRICPNCHRDSQDGVHSSREKADELRRIGQRAFEEKYGREKFLKVFGKNYL